MGIPIARLFGIEIRVTFGWVFVLAIIAVVAVGELSAIEPALDVVLTWVLGAIVAAGFFLSSVSHDLAHALVARRRGIEVRSIGVSFFGGATPFDPVSGNPGDDAMIAASGPLASLGIGAALFGLTMGVFALAGEFNAAAGVLIVLVFLNVLLGLVNLVPAYPLDGGRIVRDIVWRRSGSERSGWRAAARTGRLTGMIITGVGIAYFAFKHDMTGIMIALTGWFFVMSANAVRDRIRLDDILGGHVVREAMDESPPTVAPGLTVDTFAGQLLDGSSPLFAIPVVDGDDVVGILGPIQLRGLRRTSWATTHVGDAMAKPPKLTTLSPDEPMRPALERMYRSGLDGLPVLEDGRLIGVLTRQGVGRFVAKARESMPEPTRSSRRFGR
ncbi:MAG TPA: site-2 protease family protein [Candidatus Limnocylindrales bacterium]|nr:site-2 protease family protein [Candidatus Limnocylindrales bacterium]